MSADLSHQSAGHQGSEDGTFPDAGDFSQKYQAEHRGDENTGTVKDGFDFGEGLSGPIGDAGDQTFRRHGGELYIDVQHQTEADQENTDSKHRQLTEICGQHKISNDQFGSVYKITEDGGEYQLQQKDGLELSA